MKSQWIRDDWKSDKVCDILSENIATYRRSFMVLLADGKWNNSPVFEFQSRYINVIPKPKGIRIDVYEVKGTGKNRTQQLLIHYKFVGCIDIPEVPNRSNFTQETRKGVAVAYIPKQLTA